jgi:hypothetical protein
MTKEEKRAHNIDPEEIKIISSKSDEELTLEHLEQEINYLASRVSVLSGTVSKINSEYFNKIEKCMDNLQILTDFMEQDPKFKKWLSKEIFK